MWGTRFGSLTSIRVFPPSPAFPEALRAALDPAKMGLIVAPVKAQALEAAQGATDFGEYFTYFSFFLMVSALLLTGLFFKLGIEQRTKEIGVLRSLGFSASKIRTIFLLEGAVLATAGAAIGAAAALAYGALILLGLRTWWFDAVGTRLLSLHASLPALAAAFAAGVIAGLASVAWTLRGLEPETPRHLLQGGQRAGTSRWRGRSGAVCALMAAGLAAAALAGKLDQPAAFFGAGALLLIAACSSIGLHARAAWGSHPRPVYSWPAQRGVPPRPQHPLHRPDCFGDFRDCFARRIPARRLIRRNRRVRPDRRLRAAADRLESAGPRRRSVCSFSRAAG